MKKIGNEWIIEADWIIFCVKTKTEFSFYNEKMDTWNWKWFGSTAKRVEIKQWKTAMCIEGPKDA